MCTVQNSCLLREELPTGALETHSGRTQEAVQSKMPKPVTKKDARAKARENAKQSKEKNRRELRFDAPPLDCALNPEALWEEGKEILRASKTNSSKTYEDAAFRFLVAMFMNWSFYCGRNVKHVAKAVDQVRKLSDAETYPQWVVVLEGFSSIHRENVKTGSGMHCPNDFAQKAEAMAHMIVAEQAKEPATEPASIAEVDRFRFATGCAHVFASRNNYAAIHSQRARNAADVKAMSQRIGESCHLVNEATMYIPPHQSLTILFELSFINRYAEAYKIADSWSNQLHKAGAKWKAKVGPYLRSILERDDQGAAVAKVQQKYGGLANLRNLPPMLQMQATMELKAAACTKKSGKKKKKRQKKKK